MNKDVFNKFKIEQQVEEINKLIKKFGSVNQACKAIGIAKSTVRDRFKTNNFYYDLNNKEYKLKAEVLEQPIMNKQTMKSLDENSRNKKDYNHKKEIVNRNYESNTIVIKDENQMTNLILNNKSLSALNFISENLEKLERIVKMEDVLKRNEEYYNIVMPKFEGEVTATTIKVNKKIWNEFSEFANTCNYSKQDIISLAFKEFLDNHTD